MPCLFISVNRVRSSSYLFNVFRKYCLSFHCFLSVFWMPMTTIVIVLACLVGLGAWCDIRCQIPLFWSALTSLNLLERSSWIQQRTKLCVHHSSTAAITNIHVLHCMFHVTYLRRTWICQMLQRCHVVLYHLLY